MDVYPCNCDVGVFITCRPMGAPERGPLSREILMNEWTACEPPSCTHSTHDTAQLFCRWSYLFTASYHTRWIFNRTSQGKRSVAGPSLLPYKSPGEPQFDLSWWWLMLYPHASGDHMKLSVDSSFAALIWLISCNKLVHLEPVFNLLRWIDTHFKSRVLQQVDFLYVYMPATVFTLRIRRLEFS